MIDRLDGLRHDAVVGGDHQDDDIGDLGAAGAHGGEGGVAGGVDERDLVAVLLDLVGADVLGDAAGLAGDDAGAADGVEQRGLAVVDVAHDGDHRRTRLEIGFVVGAGEQALLDVGLGDAANGVTHLLGDELGGVGVDDVGGLDHLALLHQVLDHLDDALGHAVGEFLDGDRLGDDHLAHDLLARAGLVGAGALALAAAADRGERAGALGIVESVGERQLAAAALVGTLDGLRLRRPRRLDAPAQGTGALFFFLDLPQRLQVGRGRGHGAVGLALGLAETAAGGILGAHAHGLLGLAAGVLLGLAVFGLGALAGETFVLEGAGARDLLGVTALLGLVHLGVGERAGAGIDLVAGQLAQHQAGAGRGVRVLGRLGGPGAGLGDGGLLGRGRRGRRRRPDRLGLLLAGQHDASLLALDLNRVGAAVREALANRVALDATAALERQAWLGGDADGLVSGGLAFVHTFLRSCGRCTQFTQGIGFSVAARVGGVRAIADEIANPRQYIVARRPGKQGSMYHICPPECQIQLGAVEAADDRQGLFTIPAARRGGEAGNAVVGRLAGVDQPDDRFGGRAPPQPWRSR